jgi:2-methylaconitate cis-trans-isomerase PrpF
VSEDGRKESNIRHVVLEHSKGTIPVLVKKNGEDGIASCAVSRTARRLFEGRVIYYL